MRVLRSVTRLQAKSRVRWGRGARERDSRDGVGGKDVERSWQLWVGMRKVVKRLALSLRSQLERAANGAVEELVQVARHGKLVLAIDWGRAGAALGALEEVRLEWGVEREQWRLGQHERAACECGRGERAEESGPGEANAVSV